MDALQTYEQEKSKMMRPIPGQSMTNDPANPDPYEQAPKFTNFHEASEYMWDSLTEEAEYVKYMTAVSKGIPVMSIVQVILFNEFQQGTFNPDLMMMMVEPTAFMIIALAERLDLDIQITLDDDEDEDENFDFHRDFGRKRVYRQNSTFNLNQRVKYGYIRTRVTRALRTRCWVPESEHFPPSYRQSCLPSRPRVFATHIGSSLLATEVVVVAH